MNTVHTLMRAKDVIVSKLVYPSSPRLVDASNLNDTQLNWINLLFTWVMSVIHAAFSCLVGATKWTEICLPLLTSSTINLKSRHPCSPLQPPRLILLMLLVSLDELDDGDSILKKKTQAQSRCKGLRSRNLNGQANPQQQTWLLNPVLIRVLYQGYVGQGDFSNVFY